MEDRELEEMRRRRLAQMQQEGQGQVNPQQEAQEQEMQAQRQAVLRQILTTEARERLATLNITKPEFVQGVENQLIMLAQSGKLRAAIDDAQLKDLLKRAMPKKRDITIKRV